MAIVFDIGNSFTKSDNAAAAILTALLKRDICVSYISNHLLLLILIRANVARFKA